jgi:hypothetical protein
MNVRVPQNADKFLLSEDMLAFQEILCSLQLVSQYGDTFREQEWLNGFEQISGLRSFLFGR